MASHKINLRGHVFTDAGNPVEGATVQLIESGGTTVHDTFTVGGTAGTTSDGEWYFNEDDQNEYDIKISSSSGNTIRYIRWDDQISVKEIDVRNNTGNTIPAATFTNHTNNVSNQVAVFSGANTTRADNDEIYLSFKLANDNAELTEFARITAEANDVSNGSEDGEIRFAVMKGGNLTTVWTLDSLVSGAMEFDMNVDALTIGSGADTDVMLTFDANSADGVITWMEDEDYFRFSDDILMNSTERINFYDTAIYIYSSTDGQLDLVADTEIQIAATTIDINGAVALNGAITGATNITLSGELDAATLDLSSSADIAGDLVLSGGADGALQFTNAGENSIKIPDNQASALIIEQADNAYITFVTTNSSEAITVAKATTFSAGIANSGTIAAGTWNGTAIASGYIAADAITGAKIADDAIDSEHYTDGSIDTAHLAADAVTGAKIADDAIDSEHYANGSIDTAHIADDQVTLAKMAGLARGKLIYGDSSGNPTALAVGSANQVLTHDGTDLAWADASGSGAVSAVANGADNRIATFSSSTALNGEANLTFSGSALALSGTFAVGANTDGYDVQFFGNADGAYMLWDESADDLVLAGAARLGVGQAPEYPFQVHTSQSGDWLVDLDNTHTNPYGLRIKHSGASNNNTTNIFVQAGDASASRFFVYSNGDVANTGGTYGTISDESLKQDITSARSYWSDFKNLQVRKFRFRTDVAADSNAPYRLGFVAQEAETVFPSLVQSNQSPDESSATKWVKSSIIQGPIMVKVVQELIARVEALES